MKTTWLGRRKSWAREMKSHILALYFVCRDPRLPWIVRLLAMLVVGYALSPIDLIPDFIPILGYLDDLVLVPLGVVWVLRFVPAPLLEECRQKAEKELQVKPRNWLFGALFVALWLLGLLVLFQFLNRNYHFL